MNIEGPLDFLLQTCSKDNNLHERCRMILKTFRDNAATSPQLVLNGLLSLIEMQFTQGNQENIDAYFHLLSQAIVIFPLNIIQIVKNRVNELSQKWGFAKLLKENLICLAELFIKLEPNPLSEFGRNVIAFILSSSNSDNSIKRKVAGRCLSQILDKRNDLNQELSHQIRDFVSLNWKTSPEGMLYLVKLFDFLMKSLSLEYVGDFIYLFLKGIRTRDEVLSCHIYLVIEHALSERSVSSDVSESVAKELLYEPVSIDAEANHLQSYYQCLLQSLIRLNLVYPQGARVLLPTFLSLAVEMIDSEKKEASQYCSKAIQTAMSSIITSSFWKGNVEEDFLELDVNDLPKLWDRTVAVMSYLISKRFENHQQVCFNILATFFETTTGSSFHMIENLVRKMIDTAEEAPKNEFNLCLRNLLNNFGVENMVRLYPLKFDESMDILSAEFENESNFWLLHSMTSHLKSSSLNTYFVHILPLLNKVEKCLTTEANERKRLMLQALEKKFWALLGKCWKVEQQGEFSQLKQILELSIKKIEEGDDVVIRSLISIVSSALESNEIKSILAEHSKKIIPILAKCIDTHPHISRDVLLCLEAYSIVAPDDYLERVWLSNVDKQLKESFTKKDISVISALTSGIDIRGNKWNKILTIIKKMLASEDFYQKKAYRMINVIIPKIHESFYGIILTLIKECKEVALSARGFRINTLQLLWQRGISMLTPEYFMEKGISFIQEFLPEIILSLKESSLKARRNGKAFLLEIASKVSECQCSTQFIIMVHFLTYNRFFLDSQEILLYSNPIHFWPLQQLPRKSQQK